MAPGTVARSMPSRKIWPELGLMRRRRASAVELLPLDLYHLSALIDTGVLPKRERFGQFETRAGCANETPAGHMENDSRCGWFSGCDEVEDIYLPDLPTIPILCPPSIVKLMFWSTLGADGLEP